MRAVLDTNILISGLVFGGKPMLLFDKAAAGAFTWITSDILLVELRRVLGDKFAWSEVEIGEAIESIRKLTTVVNPQLSVSECRDPDDDRILEAAIAGNADYIVTGDADLLSIDSFRNTPIVTVAEFLRIFEDHSM